MPENNSPHSHGIQKALDALAAFPPDQREQVFLSLFSNAIAILDAPQLRSMLEFMRSNISPNLDDRAAQETLVEIIEGRVALLDMKESIAEISNEEEGN